MNILRAPTPQRWLETAAQRWHELLIDHASCEKKAASTALALMFTYPEDRALATALSRLAREELRHFEQVQSMMAQLGVTFARTTPGRYAAGLRAPVRSAEPQRKLDLLIVAALIEARSCERFRLLAPLLSDPLAGFYTQLARSEERHFEEYLGFARAAQTAQSAQAGAGELDARLALFAEREAELATRPDAAFRFHSGSPE